MANPTRHSPRGHYVPNTQVRIGAGNIDQYGNRIPGPDPNRRESLTPQAIGRRSFQSTALGELRPAATTQAAPGTGFVPKPPQAPGAGLAGPTGAPGAVTPPRVTPSVRPAWAGPSTAERGETGSTPARGIQFTGVPKPLTGLAERRIRRRGARADRAMFAPGGLSRSTGPAPTFQALGTLESVQARPRTICGLRSVPSA